MNKVSEKNSKRLMVLGAAAYFTSYLTRINFAAVIAAIIQDGYIDKTSAGAVTTVGFITYGVGQLISGWLGDRINPKHLMFTGFLVTAAMNILIPFCPNGNYMLFVWGINGFAQSLMWPPLVKIMRTAMDDNNYNRGCVVVSWGSTIATILIYLISPFVIKQWNWQAVFRINGCFAVLMSAVFMIIMTQIEKSANITYLLIKGKGEKKQKNKLDIKISFLAFAMIAIMLQGCLRDGVTTWVPTLVTEVFKLDSSISILSGVIIPIFTLASIQLTSIFYKKMGKKPYKCAGIMFVITVVCCIILRVFSAVSPIITVVLCGITVACMHGINLILVCFLPGILAGEDNVSAMSGLLNFTTYVGSALSTYGFAVLSEKTGWNGTVSSWIIIALLGAAMCILCAKTAKKSVK